MELELRVRGSTACCPPPAGAVAPRDRWLSALTPAGIARIEAIIRIHPGFLDPWSGRA